MSEPDQQREDRRVLVIALSVLIPIIVMIMISAGIAVVSGRVAL